MMIGKSCRSRHIVENFGFPRRKRSHRYVVQLILSWDFRSGHLIDKITKSILVAVRNLEVFATSVH